MCHSIFVHNFEKCRPIFKILSLLDSAVNLQQGSCHIFHRTLCFTTLPCEIEKINNSNSLYVFNSVTLAYMCF